MNILITAASSSLAYRLEKELDYASSVVFADAVDLPASLFKNRTYVRIPDEKSTSFAHILLSKCLDLDIQQIFPLRKFELLALEESRLLFEEYGITIMIPEKQSVRNYFGELKTGQLIVKNGLSQDAEKGAFLFNPDANPSLQLLTAD